MDYVSDWHGPESSSSDSFWCRC